MLIQTFINGHWEDCNLFFSWITQNVYEKTAASPESYLKQVIVSHQSTDKDSALPPVSLRIAFKVLLFVIKLWKDLNLPWIKDLMLQPDDLSAAQLLFQNVLPSDVMPLNYGAPPPLDIRRWPQYLYNIILFFNWSNDRALGFKFQPFVFHSYFCIRGYFIVLVFQFPY